MFSAAHHRHTEAIREGKPPPLFGQPPAPERMMQQAQSALAANRCPAFRPVLTAELACMQMLVARHAREQPDRAKTAALVNELRPSLEFMQALATLSYDEAQTCWTAFTGIALSDAQRTVFDRHQPLVAWRAQWEAKAAEADRQAAEQRDRQQRAKYEARPAALIAEIHLRGIKLAVDHDGKITAMPAAYLTAPEVEEIREHKAAIAALLMALKPHHATPPTPKVIA